MTNTLSLMSRFRYWLTPGKNNRWDLGYIVWLVWAGEFTYKSWQTVPFDFMAFGTGAAGLLAAGAALQLRANHDCE